MDNTSDYGLWSMVAFSSLMFPVLVWMYHRLARQEEREAIKEFGVDYIRYAEETPRFFPRLGGGFGSQTSAKNKGGIEHASL